MRNTLITLQINDNFKKAVMQCDIICCVIYISNKVDSLEKDLREFEISPRKLYCHFKRSLRCNQEIVGQKFLS